MTSLDDQNQGAIIPAFNGRWGFSYTDICTPVPEAVANSTVKAGIKMRAKIFKCGA